MAEVELWISGVIRDTDPSGKPIVRYELEDEHGSFGDFVTPVTSRLARVLLEKIGEKPPLRMEKGKRMVDEDTGNLVEWDGSAFQPVTEETSG